MGARCRHLRNKKGEIRRTWMSEPQREHGTIRIGEWLVEPSLNRVSRADEAVHLEPLAIGVLSYLARHPGRVVSADELTNELWERKFVGDNPVYRIIAELRRLLGDDARKPRYIETIRKRGYRLVADTEWLKDDSPTQREAGGSAARSPQETIENPAANPALDTAAATARRGPRHSLLPWGGAAALVAAIVLAVALLRGIDAEKPPAPPTTTQTAPIVVAVLPFENLTPRGEEYFVRGLTDAVTTRLAGISGLRVISQHSARQYENSSWSTSAIGEELGARYLVTGTALWRDPKIARGDGAVTDDGTLDRLRVSAHLVEVATDTYQWSQTFDQPLHDVFDVHANIAEQVAQRLDVTLLEPERASLRARTTNDLDAYRSYLKGRSAYDRGWLQPDIEEAIAEFETALQREPDFTLAHAALGLAHLQLYAQYFDRSDERLELAKSSIDRALELDPQLVEGRLGLGTYYFRRDLLDAAIGPLERARRDQPSNTETLSAIAQVHQRRGALGEAAEALDTAAQLDPHNHRLLYMLGQTQLVNGQYAEAERALERAITLRPELLEGYLFKAVVHMAWRGDEGLAEAEMQRAAGELGMDAVMELILQPGLSSSFRFAGESFREALDAWQLEGSGADPAAYHLAKAERAELHHDTAEARRHYEAARALLEQTVQEIPDEPYFHALLGTAYAGSGLPEEGIAAGRRALELAPIDDNPWDNADFLWLMAEIYVLAGRYDAAIKQVEQALSHPTTMSRTWMRVEPFWDPLRAHPRFRQILNTP